MARELAYWTKALADLPDRIALPVDHPTPARPSRRGGTLAFAIEADLHRRLQMVARQLGASLFMVLQAGLAALLTRLGSGTDIPLGSPVAGRTDAVLDELVGLFVNTLVLRTDTLGNPSFAELVGRVRRTNLAAYDHQALPFERLVEALQPSRTLSRHPLFQVMLAFESEQPPLLELAGLHSRPQPVTMPRAQFDLALGLVERRGPDGAPAGIAGVIDYATDLFEPAGIERLLARLLRLLQGAAEHPERRIGALEILDAAERATILQVWSGVLPPAAAQEVSVWPALFAAQARRTPDALAVLCGEQRLSYAALDAAANRLAHHLRGLGVGPEIAVGLCLERSVEAIIGLLAILKAGGVYLPLDPDDPPARRSLMLADAGAAMLVTRQSLLAQRPGLVPDAASSSGLAVVCLDADAAAIARLPATAPPPMNGSSVCSIEASNDADMKSAERKLSSTPNSRASVVILLARLACSTTTALGRPVDPDV
jgi:non-ribosomal peptide synthetase component F